MMGNTGEEEGGREGNKDSFQVSSVSIRQRIEWLSASMPRWSEGSILGCQSK